METVKPKRQRRSFERKLADLDRRIATSQAYAQQLLERRVELIAHHRAKAEMMLAETERAHGNG